LKTAGVLLLVSLPVAAHSAFAESVVDERTRAEMLRRNDGRIAHLETEYNDIFITKRGPLLALSTRFKDDTYIESIVNLRDPDDLPVPYTRIMSVALAYPEKVKRVLMIGLGAGSISTYLARAMPDVQVDVVELDPGVIEVGKKYFGLRDAANVHFIESDGRVYLNRHKDVYDVILLDAYRELGVPFHLLTREFYSLVRERLAPGGVAAFNVNANTRLYLATLSTLRAVFDTVDVYPDRTFRGAIQAIAVVAPGAAPNAETLISRANALQGQQQFRYQLPAMIRRKATQSAPKGEVLTDDFAPVNLYETMPTRRRNKW
jgi:spermidine synthase